MRPITALVLMLAGASRVFACAPAPHDGERVNVVEESAVIVWDAATKTQHFIRRATFRGSARDFGFLVPTPTAPTLAAVDDFIFDLAQTKTERQTIHTNSRKIDWTPAMLLFFSGRSRGDKDTATAAPVEVLSTQKVAGYEAVVLDATDATALRDWLAENGYATSPDLVEWLEAYIAQRWKITAFKIDKEQSDVARTSAVKMSFITDRPFFPYREPASQRMDSLQSRALRLWFIGPDRVAGTIGASTSWPAYLKWSDRLDDATRTRLADLSGVAIPAAARLTHYDDTSSIRPGTDDLFFLRDADQSVVIPPPYIVENVDTTHIPLDVLVLPIVFVGFGVWRRKRRRHIASLSG
jgi:hypothetical protein